MRFKRQIGKKRHCSKSGESIHPQVSQAYREQHGLVPDKIAGLVMVLYRQVDEYCAGIESNLNKRGIMTRCCAGCSSCCIDDLTMTQAEASVIRRLYPNIGQEKAHEEGMCAFLDESGRCRIYEARPLKCRTFGMPFSDKLVDEFGNIEESRDICELRAEDMDIEGLDSSCVYDSSVANAKLGLMEMVTFNEVRRIAYRSFFSSEN